MLVLTRKQGEELIIGNAVVKVMKIRGSRVSLAVTADVSVPVARKELGTRGAGNGQGKNRKAS
jgi:carbon storage regulator CsrA